MLSPWVDVCMRVLCVWVSGYLTNVYFLTCVFVCFSLPLVAQAFCFGVHKFTAYTECTRNSNCCR